MIIHLACAREQTGRDECMRRGWLCVGMYRFITPGRNDIRVVSRMSDVTLFPGTMPFLKASDYDPGPSALDVFACAAWEGIAGTQGQRAEFEAFIASGRAKWIDSEDDLDENGVIRSPAVIAEQVF